MRRNYEGTTVYKCYQLVSKYFNGNIQKTVTWFYTKNPGIGNILPTEMIDRGREEKLLKFIQSQLEGNFP